MDRKRRNEAEYARAAMTKTSSQERWEKAATLGILAGEVNCAEFWNGGIVPGVKKAHRQHGIK
jgi:hypothetical protein